MEITLLQRCPASSTRRADSRIVRESALISELAGAVVTSVKTGRNTCRTSASPPNTDGRLVLLSANLGFTFTTRPCLGLLLNRSCLSQSPVTTSRSPTEIVANALAAAWSRELRRTQTLVSLRSPFKRSEKNTKCNQWLPACPCRPQCHARTLC